MNLNLPPNFLPGYCCLYANYCTHNYHSSFILCCLIFRIIFSNLLQAIILGGFLCAAVVTADQSHHQSFKQVSGEFLLVVLPILD